MFASATSQICSIAQERRAEALRQGGLVTYKNQASYGLHVIVVMAVFYLMGHLIASRISDKAGLVRICLSAASKHSCTVSVWEVLLMRQSLGGELQEAGFIWSRMY